MSRAIQGSLHQDTVPAIRRGHTELLHTIGEGGGDEVPITAS
jgi:hypothetical protein